jgi:hypothetical protein
LYKFDPWHLPGTTSFYLLLYPIHWLINWVNKLLNPNFKFYFYVYRNGSLWW